MRVVMAGALTVVALILVGLTGRDALGETPTPTASPFHTEPAIFSGTACIDGECLGTLEVPVVAKIGDVVCGEMPDDWYPPTDGQATMRYYVPVAPEEEIDGCGTEGATVEFYIDGRRANQTATWSNGGNTGMPIWVGEDFAAFGGYSTCNGEPCYFCFEPCPTARFKAYIGDKLCGAMTPSGYLIGNGFGPLTVKSDAAEPGCGTPGATVRFTINDVPVHETGIWQPGFQWLSLSAGNVIWGDNNCSGALEASDVLRILRFLLNREPDAPICFSLLALLGIEGSEQRVRWVDIDCSNDLTIEDAIKVLHAVGGLPIEHAPGCPDPGAVLPAYPIVEQ